MITLSSLQFLLICVTCFLLGLSLSTILSFFHGKSVTSNEQTVYIVLAVIQAVAAIVVLVLQLLVLRGL